MRSRQVSLPRLRWRTTPGSLEPGARRACGDALQRGDLVEHRQPASSSRRHARRGRAPAPSAGAIDGDDLSGGDGVARPRAPARRRRTPAHGAVTTVSIFIALTTSSASPACTSSPSRDADVDDRAAHRAARRASLAGGDRRAAGPAAARWRRGRAAERGGLLVERACSAAPCVAVRGSSGASASSVVRASPARTLGMGQDRAQLGAVGRQPGDVELVERAPRAVDGASRATPTSSTGRSPWPAAGRTAAAARSPT